MFDELFQDSGLSLERLQTLCLLAKAHGITEAARGDATRQSQFSRQLAELEEFFGVELVNRTSRPRRLTTEGQELAQIAQQSLAALEDFRRRGKQQTSRVVVGAGDSVIQWLLLPRLKKLQAALPGTAFVFKNLNTSAIVHGLESGDVDVGIVRQNALPEGMKTAGRFTYGHLLVIPASLHVKTAKSKTYEALSALPLAIMEGAGDLRQSLDKLAKKRGFKLDVRLECSSFSQIAMAISSGNMAGILPDFAKPHLPSLSGKSSAWHYESLPELERVVAVTWSPSVAKLRPAVREAAVVMAKVLRG